MTTNTVPVSEPNVKLAQAYVPYQQYRDLYNVNEAIYRGTIFRELFRPYQKAKKIK